MLVPPIGLAINDFVGGVEFFKTLPSIDEPDRAARPGLPAPDAPFGRPVARRRSSSRS